MFKYFKRDRLTDKQFKLSIVFLSLCWPLYLGVLLGIFCIALPIVFCFLWIIYMVTEPKETWSDTIKYIKKIIY